MTSDYFNNCTYWYNDKQELHKSDGPAVEPDIDNFYSFSEWYYNGKLGRVGGLAKIYMENPGCWENLDEFWINGNYYTEEEYERVMISVKKVVVKFKSLINK
jgi:hypothetical protein